MMGMKLVGFAQLLSGVCVNEWFVRISEDDSIVSSVAPEIFIFGISSVI
jgi:hypothetical protein